MRRQRQAKIVATLGPASSDSTTIRALFDAGADVFRFNFSHGSHEQHRERARHRAPHRGRDRPPDRHPARPAGPQAARRHLCRRTGRAAGRRRRSASTWIRRRATPAARSLPHPEIFAALKVGTDLLLDDGKIRLTVIDLRCRFRRDPGHRRRAALSERKGVNVPSVLLPISALTEKDRADLEFGLDTRRRLGRAVVRAAARGPAGSPRHRQGPGRRDVQAREAGGDRTRSKRSSSCPMR